MSEHAGNCGYMQNGVPCDCGLWEQSATLFKHQGRIAALEAALEEIVALYDDEDWPDDSGAMLQPLEIARAALAAAETEVKHGD